MHNSQEAAKCIIGENFMEFIITCPICNSNIVEVFATIDMEVIFICKDCGHRETKDE